MDNFLSLFLQNVTLKKANTYFLETGVSIKQSLKIVFADRNKHTDEYMISVLQTVPKNRVLEIMVK